MTFNLSDPQTDSWFHVVLTVFGYGFFRALEETIVRIINNGKKNKDQ